MKRILPINDKPVIKTYTHHGFFHAIASSEDKVLQNKDTPVVELRIKDFDPCQWNHRVDNLKVECSEHGVKCFADSWNIDMNCAFWRKCRENDDVEICIEKQIYSNAFSSVSVSLVPLDADLMNWQSMKVRAGYFSRDGIFYALNAEAHHVVREEGINVPIRLKRESKDVYLILGNSDDCEKIQLSDSFDLPECQIVIWVNCANNNYYEWMYSQYINVFSNIDAYIALDYLGNAHKDWNSHTEDFFFDYYFELPTDIEKLGFSEIEYIKKMIDLNRYVEVENNDMINMKLPDDPAPYFHQDLIYGYDDDQKCFYLLYYHNGIIEKCQMTYEAYASERNYKFNRRYFVLKYCPAYENMVFSKDYVLKQFKEFGESVNVLFYENAFEKDYVFGMNCFRALLKPEWIKKVIADIRISHFLYERANCNRKRVDYFVARGILAEEQAVSLRKCLDDEIGCALILRNYVLKKLQRQDEDPGDIPKRLEKIIGLEEIFTKEMINSLEIC